MTSPTDDLAPREILGQIRTELVQFNNTTTKTQIEDLRSSQIIEMGERDLILKIPRGSCSQGHMLLVTLVFKEGGAPEKDLHFSATCVVNMIESVDKDHDGISVRMQQYGKKEWEDCLSASSRRHLEVENLLFATKGTESQITSGPKDFAHLKEYLVSRKALIADDAPPSRALVAKMLVELGMSEKNIVQVGTYAEAQVELTRLSPDITIAGYRIDGFNGLELAQVVKCDPVSIKNNIFILITGSVSQSFIAQAAEEDIDGHLTTPFTIPVLRLALQRIFSAKFRPPPYLETIDKGRGELLVRHYPQAEATFKQALSMEERPALAHYYLGAVALAKKEYAAAEAHFRTGLGISKVHSRCLLGLFEALKAKGRSEEAYETVCRYCKYFPPTPDVLDQALELAIMLKHFSEVERFFANYGSVDEPGLVLTERMCEGLIGCARVYLANQSRARASELFKQTLAIAKPFPVLLEEMLKTIKGIEHAT